MTRTALAVLIPAMVAGSLAGFPGVAPAAPPTAEPGSVTGSTESIPLVGASARGALHTDADLAAGARSLRTVVTGRSIFSAVGVTWRDAGSAVAVSVAVRTRSAPGAAWSAWAGADDDEAGARSGRGGSDMIWTGRARVAEVVVTSASLPKDLRLELIDPGRGAVDAEAASRPGATGEPERAGTLTVERAPVLMQYPRLVPRPVIYTRKQWGADELYRTWDAEYAPIRAAVLHHTATPNGYSKSDVPAIIRGIYRFHAVSREWGDIGYNVIVDRFGRAWEGRAGGLARPTIGAHAGGFNTGTTGIAMLGNNTSAKPTPAQLEMVARIVAWKLGRVGIDPRGKTHMLGGPNTKYATQVYIPLPVLFPHRSTSKTACPGRVGMAALPGLRIRAARIMSAAPLQPKPAAAAPARP